MAKGHSDDGQYAILDNTKVIPLLCNMLDGSVDQQTSAVACLSELLDHTPDDPAVSSEHISRLICTRSSSVLSVIERACKQALARDGLVDRLGEMLQNSDEHV